MTPTTIAIAAAALSLPAVPTAALLAWCLALRVGEARGRRSVVGRVPSPAQVKARRDADFLTGHAAGWATARRLVRPRRTDALGRLRAKWRHQDRRRREDQATAEVDAILAGVGSAAVGPWARVTEQQRAAAGEN